MLGLIDNGKVWKRLVEAAMGHASSSSSEGAVRAFRLDVTRKLYAALLLPFSGDRIPMQRNVNARVAAAVIALRLLDDEEARDSTILSSTRLAAMAGWQWKRALRSLDELVSVGIATKPRSGPFIAGRYRLTTPSKSRMQEVDAHEASMNALVDGDPDVLGAAILSVTHPIWAYSDRFNHTHWLWLVGESAGLDRMGTYSMRPVIDRRIRKELLEVLDPAGADLWATLDRMAEDPEFGILDVATGNRIPARQARRQAMSEYRKQAAEHKQVAEAATKRKRGAFAAVEALLLQFPIPVLEHWPDDDDRAEHEAAIAEWATAVHEVGVTMTSDPERREAIRRALTSRLRAVGVRRPDEVAECVVAAQN